MLANQSDVALDLALLAAANLKYERDAIVRVVTSLFVQSWLCSAALGSTVVIRSC